MYSWGAGSSGQLGTGHLADGLTPKAVEWALGQPDVIACGGNHVVALTGGAAKYWGLARSSGQGAEAGTPKVAAQPQLIPAALFLGTSVTTVSAGWSHTAFVTDDGCLWMTGDGAFGQLGLGQNVRYAARPVRLQGALASHQVLQAACGMHHTLTLTRPTYNSPSTHVSSSAGHSGPVQGDDLVTSGHTVIFAFGAHRKGQCGVTVKHERRAAASSLWEPAALVGFSSSALVTQVLAGGHHSGALDSEGCLHLWGGSFTGTAHSAVTTAHQPSSSSEQPPGAQSEAWQQHSTPAGLWKQVSLGWGHVVGLDTAGRVWAWGSNRFGQCGQPPDSYPVLHQPTLAQLDRPATCVSAGSEHSAAVSADGGVYSWGWGEHGQLGVGTESDSWLPMRVDLSPCVRVVCGTGYSLAVKA